MDLQGTPIGRSSGGTKVNICSLSISAEGEFVSNDVQVTSDPSRYNNPIHEGPGPIANDSLAAESSRTGGAFSENRDSVPLGVSGNQSTFNNRDTSSASQLSSAENAASRGDAGPEGRYPEALGGQGEYPGKHLPETGYTGGSTRAKKDLGLQGHQYNTQERQAAEAGGSGTISSAYYGGEAPTYVTPVVQGTGSAKPKGNDIREGGFDSVPSRNASFNSDIGTKKDPGRLAEQKFEGETAKSANASGFSANVQRDQPYQALNRNEQA